MKESIFIGRVSDVFQIHHRGLVIVPVEPWGTSVKAGDTLELKNSDGTCLVTHVRGVEMVNPTSVDGKVGLLIGDGSLLKEDVPEGTEVYVTRPT